MIPDKTYLKLQKIILPLAGALMFVGILSFLCVFLKGVT
jgi:hypothetical protein